MLDPVPPTPVEVQIAFDYSQFDSETRIICQQTAKEIKDLAQQDAAIRIQIGRRLIEIKERIGHGLFQAWVDHEFQWHYRVAANLMAIAREFTPEQIEGKPIHYTALRILASASQEAKAEALEAAEVGLPITKDHAADLKKAYSLPKESKPQPFPVGMVVWIVQGKHRGLRGIVHHHEGIVPYVEVNGAIEPMFNHWLSRQQPKPQVPIVVDFEDSRLRAKPVKQISPLEALSNEAENLRVRCGLLEDWIHLVIEQHGNILPADVIAKGEKLLA